MAERGDQRGAVDHHRGERALKLVPGGVGGSDARVDHGRLAVDQGEQVVTQLAGTVGDSRIWITRHSGVSIPLLPGGELWFS